MVLGHLVLTRASSSSLSYVQVDDMVYSVCDSSWAISKFSDNLQPFGPDNVQIGQPDREKEV